MQKLPGTLALFSLLASLPLSRSWAQDAGKGGGKTEGEKPRVVNGIKVPKLKSPTGPITAGDVPVGTRNVKFGAGFGISTNLRAVYSYTLVAPDYALNRQHVSPVSGVVSGVVMYNKTIYYYRGDDANSKPYARPYPLSMLLSVNLASFAANTTSTAAGYNSRLDLGLGVGYRFDDNVQVGLFVDFASQRFLRDAYAQYEGKPVPDFKQNQNLTALDATDDHYFISLTVPSISLKLIFNLPAEQPKAKDVQQAEKYVKQAKDSGVDLKTQ